ncbi:MAG: PQQ-like beta-propeller repeat protein [Planctomycetales bacterium]|nr:PQQ-like beta-propeller repeat protein [Planctomycetales bacterium]
MKVCTVALCANVWLMSCCFALAADWPQWRGPQRTGVSEETGLLQDWDAQQPKLLWMVEGTGHGYAGVSIAEGTIYTTGNFGDGQAVVALNAADGSQLWRQAITDSDPKHGYDGSRSTPSIDGDRLYVVSSNGAIHCLRRNDGSVAWSRDFKDWGGKMMSGWGFAESPLVDGPWVLCTPGGSDAMIVALDKMTGEEIWKSAQGEFGGKGKDGAGYSSIVVSQGAGVKQYVQLTGRGVIGVRASDGKFLWGYNEVANTTANIPTPVVSGDYVFASSGYGTGAGLVKLSAEGDGVKAEEVYFLPGKTFQNHHGGMLLIGEHIYCGHNHNNGFPICLALKTGEVIWGGDERGAGSGSAAVVYADGNIIFRYQDGVVALVEATPSGYKLKGKFKPEYQEGKSWAHPVVVDGKLYLREQNKLMCYDVKR